MKKIDRFYLFLPLLLGIACFFLNMKYPIITIHVPGLTNIIDSIINYTSIIIGVLTALFGIVVTLTDKDVMLKLQKNNDDKTIFKYGVETLISNFLLLVLSIVMQSLVRFESPLSYIDWILNIWSGIIVFSLTSSIRTIYFLLMISFNQNDNSQRPVSNYTITEQERIELRQSKSENKNQ